MNYFAHGRRFTHDPYFLAGTAAPDWLSVVDRKCRARERLAAPLVDDADAVVAAVARGVVQHHRDDAWFHQSRAFNELCLRLTILVRDALPPDQSLRPSFLGHILVELLLDAELIARHPQQIKAYYAALDALDPLAVNAALQRMTTKPTDRIAPLIPRFSAERFLYDYAEDGKLLYRLNAVLRRVKLPELPAGFESTLAAVRTFVRPRVDELLDEDKNTSGR
jgi:hypothetical protein